MPLREGILQAKLSLLLNNGNPCKKRNTGSLFYVTMGSYDGAETCVSVGIYILSQLKEIPLITTWKLGFTEMTAWQFLSTPLPAIPPPKKKIERIKKEICKVFAKNNLRVTIEINTKA